MATYDKHNGTFKYVNSLSGFDRVTLPGYHFEYNDDLLGEVESMIVQKNVIKRGDEVVVGPGEVLYYPNNKKLIVQIPDCLILIIMEKLTNLLVTQFLLN